MGRELAAAAAAGLVRGREQEDVAGVCMETLCQLSPRHNAVNGALLLVPPSPARSNLYAFSNRPSCCEYRLLPSPSRSRVAQPTSTPPLGFHLYPVSFGRRTATLAVQACSERGPAHAPPRQPPAPPLHTRLPRLRPGPHRRLCPVPLCQELKTPRSSPSLCPLSRFRSLAAPPGRRAGQPRRPRRGVGRAGGGGPGRRRQEGHSPPGADVGGAGGRPPAPLRATRHQAGRRPSVSAEQSIERPPQVTRYLSLVADEPGGVESLGGEAKLFDLCRGAHARSKDWKSRVRSGISPPWIEAKMTLRRAA